MNQNTVSGNLDRIKRATDDMRLTTGTVGEDIETVAQAVSDLNDDNIAKDETIAELEQEIEDITPKGSIEITNNGVINVASYQYADVQIEIKIPDDNDDIIFFDLDGNLIASYSKQEFLQLSSLPTCPNVDGLITDGWNVTLAKAKEYLNNGSETLEIGPTYSLPEGNIFRFKVKLEDETLDPYLNLDVSNSIIIDWGDGTTTESSGTIREHHHYNTPGVYIINIYGDSTYNLPSYGERNSWFWSDAGVYHDWNAGLYRATVLELYFSNKVRGVGPGNLPCVTRCSFPLNMIPDWPDRFHVCFIGYNSLRGLSYPVGFERNNNYFEDMHSLKYISIINTTSCPLIKTLTSLVRLSLPNLQSVQGQLLNECQSLRILDLPNLSSSSKYWSNDYRLIQNCYNLSRVNLKSLTTINNMDHIFYDAYNIRKLSLPSFVIDSSHKGLIGQSMYITDLYLPNISYIPSYVFYGWAYIPCFVFNNNIPYIGNYAFNQCRNLKRIDFSHNTQVPTLDGGDAFGYVYDDFKIIVPDSLYEDWIVANNWANISNHIIKVSEWEGGNN